MARQICFLLFYSTMVALATGILIYFVTPVFFGVSDPETRFLLSFILGSIVGGYVIAGAVSGRRQ